MSQTRTVEPLLRPISGVAGKHIKAALHHYSKLVEYFRVGDFENCLAKAGKFVEAVLKSLCVYAGMGLPPGRGFKVDKVINGLAQLDPKRFDDTVRLLIPRALRFVYDLASNRGGRHDPDNIDPNEMGARIAVETCSWVLAEMIRFCQVGKVAPSEAKELVDALTEKKYSVVEDVEGRVYFNKEEKSALEVALVALWRKHPTRLGRAELKETIMRHSPRPGAPRFSDNAASVALTRLAPLVDDDGDGNLKLLSIGLAKAEKLISSTDQK